MDIQKEAEEVLNEWENRVYPDSVFEFTAPRMAELIRLMLPMVKDAERYRWLRKYGNRMTDVYIYPDEILDSAIDQAMKGG